MDDLTSRLAAKLREVLEFFNDAPRFSLRNNRRRDSYQIAGEIDLLLEEADGSAPPPAPSIPSDTALNVRMSDAKSYTPLQMEAALCAWEWMLEHQSLGADNTDLWEAMGASAMRNCSIQAGCIALLVHEHMEAQGYEFIGAYDWEFVPSILERLDWRALANDNQYHLVPYRPDVAALFVVVLTADMATHPPSHRLFFKRGAA
ncbi:hypothetical protein J2X65_003517 [Ancylobacter sp. 3268]|uniref:hypothetical protein n=1 Tax=Ancylobacter sp. 3268 TaxID=2817752 RepID=UPI00285E8728|nr:hypothetical protein [Ancylobacter sp. 3268]MDR6954149.1 hypothetical protein [Ancylobacter sp. 3268]